MLGIIALIPFTTVPKLKHKKLSLHLFLILCEEEERVKNTEQFSGAHILQTTDPFSIKSGTVCKVMYAYVEHKMCKFSPVVLET